MVEHELRGHVVVISPHLDDAVLALGATVARAVKLGADVGIVTVFAGDPASTTPAGVWDHGCGFRSAGKAAHTRRQEDQRACSILGATPVWLPFSDNQYDRGRDAARVGAALEPHVEKADVLLLPGFPLTHPDHVCATEVVLGKAPRRARIGFYVEQPYVRQSGIMPAASDGYGAGAGGSLRWVSLHAGIADRLAKGRACRAYWSQFRRFRWRLPFNLFLPEIFWTDERLGWPEARRP